MIFSLIIWYHILSHAAICFCDFSQLVPLVDFVTRPDGSASDPTQLEPLELIYAGVTAMAFGTVAACYIFALVGVGTIRGAAATSAFFHGLWVIHMTWRWKAWHDMMHPDASIMTPVFFLASHVVWTTTSIALLFLPSTAIQATNDKRKVR